MRLRAEKSRRLAAMGLLAALAAALNFLESLIPAIPALPPGVRLGLSNLPVAYCLFYLGGREALAIAVLKSGFVLLTRGATAGAMSLAGGLLSLLVMLALRRLTRPGPMRCFYVSVPGAMAHNAGQLCMASVLLRSPAVFYSFPLMLIAGAGMGLVTAVLLRTVLPALGRVSGAMEKHSGKDE